jgi:hypothetical protein
MTWVLAQQVVVRPRQIWISRGSFSNASRRRARCDGSQRTALTGGVFRRQLWEIAEMLDVSLPVELTPLRHHVEHLRSQDSTDQLNRFGLVETCGDQSPKSRGYFRRIIRLKLIAYDRSEDVSEPFWIRPMTLRSRRGANCLFHPLAFLHFDA